MDAKPITLEDLEEGFRIALERARNPEPPVEVISYQEYLRRIGAEGEEK